jgi:predicted transcriptional regulator
VITHEIRKVKKAPTPTTTAGKSKSVSFNEFAETFMAVGRGEQIPPDWAGRHVYVSEKAREFWSTETSKDSKAKSLSHFVKLIDDNLSLLSAIQSHQWNSVAELASAIARKEPNVSRSLSKLERFGVVTLVPTEGRKKKPEIASRKLAFEIDVVTGAVELIESPREGAERVRGALRAAASTSKSERPRRDSHRRSDSRRSSKRSGPT